MKFEELRKIAEASPTVAFQGDRESDVFYRTFSPSLIIKLLDELRDAREALDSIATLIDDDSVKTITDDGEEESWVSDSSIQHIYDEFLAKYKENL